MNDNDKFRKFFGFGGGNDEKGTPESGSEPVLSEKEQLEKVPQRQLILSFYVLTKNL